MAQTNSNGARAKILRALITEGMLTTGELAQQTGLTGEQARANVNAAVACGLIVKGKESVTGLLGYQVTPLGKQWVNDKVQKAGALLSATTGSEAVQPAQETVAEPAQPPEQYAICRAGQAHLSAWPLRDMSLDDAKQFAVDEAVATHGEVVLYRYTPIGRAVPRIVFEEA